MGLLIILAAFIATTHIVLLSYLFSTAFREFFKEPLFLKYMMQKFSKSFSEKNEEIVGWIIPYVIGLFFVICFHLLLQYGVLNLSWWSGFIFGGTCGLIILGWWHFMFKISYSIDIDFKRYYRQLFFAHIVFGFTVVGVYRFLM